MEGSLPPRASDILAVRMGKVSHPLDLQPCWLLLGLAPTGKRRLLTAHTPSGHPCPRETRTASGQSCHQWWSSQAQGFKLCHARLPSIAPLSLVRELLPAARCFPRGAGCFPGGAGWSRRGNNSRIADLESRFQAAFHKLWSGLVRLLCTRPSLFVGYWAKGSQVLP